MKIVHFLQSIALVLCSTLLLGTSAYAFSDVTNKTYEKDAIAQVVAKNWLPGQHTNTFGYGVSITPAEWLRILMFLRTDDACPEYGMTPTAYWTPQTISACLAGSGVPVDTFSPTVIRRDEAMQQLFALRRRSFAFQSLQTQPVGYREPSDLRTITTNRKGAMIAADRLKLLFRTKNNLLPASPLLREDAALAVSRFVTWEGQDGVDQETMKKLALSKDATLNHWRDLDTDIYVIEVKMGGDTLIRPILPRRSFNPATTTATAKETREEYVYEPVSNLAKESGALAAINGSYFNVQWPWGALEDVAILNGKTLLERSDRSTFVVCADGKLYLGNLNTITLKANTCTPQQALGAGPLFMSKGEILTASTKEGFDEYTQWERRVGTNARTAIGVSTDRKTAYFIIVAGKSYPAFGRGGASLGTFLKEKYPALSDAMMYDGGGSTTLFVQGKTLVGLGETGNQRERPVVSALGIFSKKTEQLAQVAFAKEQKKRWDKNTVTIKIEKPKTAFPWKTVKDAKTSGTAITLNGNRGSQVQLIDPEDGVRVFMMTFDKIVSDKTSGLTITRREGTHEYGWNIPTELHVINPNDDTDTDIIKLFKTIPIAQRPDLKTFDAVVFRPTGLVFGDASGRHWYYYAKARQLSPAIFPEKKTVPVKK